MFNKDEASKKLRQFTLRNVRIDEKFEIGTKRLSARDILVPIEGKLLLACTDERAVKEIINPKTGERLDISQFTLIRAAGAAFGLVDAIRNIKVTLEKEQILKALDENNVAVANHIDTHAAEGRLTGCGQGALREYTQSGSIFDRPAMPLHERIAFYEEMGALRAVLEGEHTALGLVVNPYSNRVLDPGSALAERTFFSLDMGIYREVLHWIEGALEFGEEAMQQILIKLTRNNLAAVFILSNGEINKAIYIERGDDKDQFFAGVLHQALGELKEREGPIMHLMEERMTG